MRSKRAKYNRIAEFIGSIFPEDGEVQLCCIAPSTNRMTGIFVAQKNQLQKFVAEKFHAFQRNNYYLTKNTFKKSGRMIESLYSYANIVIDIDDHRPFSAEIVDDEIKLFVEEMKAAIEGESIYAELPEPSMVVFTGRGIQVWYSFECIAASNAYVYHAVQDELIARYKKICAGLEGWKDFFGLEVDAASSGNDAGLYRIPNTYNTKTRKMAKLLYGKGRKYNFWGRTGLSSVCRKEGFCSPLPEKKKKAKAINWTARTDSPVCSAIEKLILVRGYRHYPAEGMRDLLCYVYFNAALQAFGEERAFTMTRQLNKKFCDSFSEKELMTHIRHIARKRTTHRFTGKSFPGYLHSRRYIIDILGITEAEQIQIGFFASGKESAAKHANPAHTSRKTDKRQKLRAKRIQDRNRARLLHQKHPEMSMRSIAQECGYTRQWATMYSDTPFEGDWSEKTYQEGKIIGKPLEQKERDSEQEIIGKEVMGPHYFEEVSMEYLYRLVRSILGDDVV